MKISIIAAMGCNRVIGDKGKIPWYLSDDLKRFKKLTMGKPIIMGRKTWHSLPEALPGREHIVISSRSIVNPAVTWVRSPVEALAHCFYAGYEEVMVIGGATIYKQLIPLADTMYLTLFDGEFIGDTIFPSWDYMDWTVTNIQHCGAHPEKLIHNFMTFVKRKY